MRAHALVSATLAAFALLAPLQAFAQTASDRWTFSVMPYLWLPSVDGALNYGPPPAGGATARVSVDADSYLDNLDLALMVSGEARKGRWLIGTDVIYLDFGKADSAVQSVDFNAGAGPINVSTTALNAATDSKLSGWLWTLAGGYAAIQDPRASLDVIGGFRYFTLDAKTDWQLAAAVTGPAGTTTFARAGSVEKSEDIWPPSSARKAARSSGRATGSSTTTWMPAAARRRSRGRAWPGSGTPSSGATSSWTTATSITVRAAKS
jgi:hypothetical protein